MVGAKGIVERIGHHNVSYPTNDPDRTTAHSVYCTCSHWDITEVGVAACYFILSAPHGPVPRREQCLAGPTSKSTRHTHLLITFSFYND